MHPDGRYAAAWNDHSGSDGDGVGVRARLFAADGAPSAGDFLLNTYTAGAQQDADLAAAGNSQLIAVWTSEGQDGAGMGVYGQRIDSGGTKQGVEFKVSEYTEGHQWYPSAAGFPDGSFVIVYQSDSGQEGNGAGVFARRYDAEGNPLYR